MISDIFIISYTIYICNNYAKDNLTIYVKQNQDVNHNV